MTKLTLTPQTIEDAIQSVRNDILNARDTKALNLRSQWSFGALLILERLRAIDYLRSRALEAELEALTKQRRRELRGGAQ